MGRRLLHSFGQAALQLVRDLHFADVRVFLALHLVDLVVRDGAVQTLVVLRLLPIRVSRLRVVFRRGVVLTPVQDGRVLSLICRVH